MGVDSEVLTNAKHGFQNDLLIPDFGLYNDTCYAISNVFHRPQYRTGTFESNIYEIDPFLSSNNKSCVGVPFRCNKIIFFDIDGELLIHKRR